MATEFNRLKQKMFSVVYQGAMFFAAVVTIIGFLIAYLVKPEQKNHLPGGESPVPTQTLTIKETKSISPIPKSQTNIPGSEVTQKSIPLSKAIVVLIVENETTIDWTLSSMIASLLKKQGVSVTTSSVFTDSFLTGGGFSRLFNGGSRQVSRAQLSRHFKTGVLGKKAVAYEKSADFKDIITAAMTLELHVISSQTGAVQLSLSFTQKGAGFSNAEAGKIAEENILREIETQLPMIVDHLGQ